MQWWRVEKNGLGEEIKNKMRGLMEIQGMEEQQLNDTEPKLRREVERLEVEEDLRWRQRAKEWLKNGDRNTKYFHACATQRQRKNQITSIQDESGRVWETQDSIGGAFVHYFSTLFTSEFRGDVAACLHPVERNHPRDEFDVIKGVYKRRSDSGFMAYVAPKGTGT